MCWGALGGVGRQSVRWEREGADVDDCNVGGGRSGLRGGCWMFHGWVG